MAVNEAPTKSSLQSFWTIQSNSKLLRGYLAGLGALGMAVIYLTRSRVQDSPNTLAAYWLGILLLSVAVGTYLFFEDTIIRVDSSIRSLVILKKGRLTKSSSVVPYDEISAVQVATIGSAHRGVVTHHLVIQLKNGKRVTPGRFSTDQAEIIEVAQRLARETGSECIIGRRLVPLTTPRYVLSAVGAVLVYVLWYRFKVGPWCPAMWYGSAPPVIIALSFFGLLGISRRL
ncbi:MAG: hypothetical protein ACJ763_01865 [Bdellovibrionia bacterium]